MPISDLTIPCLKTPERYEVLSHLGKSVDLVDLLSGIYSPTGAFILVMFLLKEIPWPT